MKDNGKKSKAVFLDRDGTLIEDLGYNSNPKKIFPLEGVFEGLKKLAKNGYLLVVITNQSGVSRGFFSEEELEKMNSTVNKIFFENGITLAGIYSCIHLPNTSCFCRKPKPGLILNAAKELHIDIPSSAMIGDKISDVEAGISAGCKKNILLDTTGQFSSHTNSYNFTVAKSFKEAVDIILNQDYSNAENCN